MFLATLFGIWWISFNFKSQNEESLFVGEYLFIGGACRKKMEEKQKVERPFHSFARRGYSSRTH